MTSPQNQAALHLIVEAMAAAERNADTGYFEKLLADSLTFRRANGSVVGKAEYLQGLSNHANFYEKLEASSIVVSFYEDMAIASLIVDAAGEREGKPFAGQFRNIRLFLVEPDSPLQWRLHSWFNTKLT